MGSGGGLGGVVSGLFGASSEGDFNMDPYNPDPNAYKFGGMNSSPEAVKYGQAAQGAQDRGAVTLGTADTNCDRAQQQQALALQQQAAQGNAPSQAQILGTRAADDAVRTQMAMAAGARGPAAMANAQYAAQGNAAQIQQQNATQMAGLRAQEMAQARGDYMAGASGLRSADYQQAATQAQLQAQQNALNDQMTLGMTGYEYGANNAQLNASMQQQAQIANDQLGAYGLNLKAMQGQDQINNSNGVMGVALGAGAAMMMSDERAKTNVTHEGGSSTSTYAQKYGPDAG